MDQDFFTEGEYQQSQQPGTSHQQIHHQSQQNHWQQAEVHQTPVQSSDLYSMESQNGYTSNIGQGFAQSSTLEVDDEVTRKIAEEQNRINQILREKSTKQYDQKQARKANGQQQLVEFLEQKEKQTMERKQQNIQNERNLIQKARELTQKAGWGKVFENVNLKLGEYKGAKNVNRMRESILNKFEDERTSK